MFEAAALETPDKHVMLTRGYSVVYREDEPNHCPGCGRMQWLVGRVSAECAFCATAIPLVLATSRGSGTHHCGRSVGELMEWGPG